MLTEKLQCTHKPWSPHLPVIGHPVTGCSGTGHPVIGCPVKVGVAGGGARQVGVSRIGQPEFSTSASPPWRNECAALCFIIRCPSVALAQRSLSVCVCVGVSASVCVYVCVSDYDCVCVCVCRDRGGVFTSPLP